MSRARTWFLVACGLFAGWVIFLVFLVMADSQAPPEPGPLQPAPTANP